MGIFSGVQDFFHSLTTNDHYASSEAARNSSKHRINQLPNGSSTSITMLDNSSSASITNQNNPNAPSSNRSSTSNAPFQYRPGLRSQLQHNSSSADIQLQDYVEGQPPLPSIGDLWDKLDTWLEREYAELGEELEDGCTSNDLNEFEKDFAVSLPLDVRESYQIHDGQVQLGKKRGLIYGYDLLDLESIAAECSIWRKTAEKLEEHRDLYYKIKSSNAPSSSATANEAHRKIINFMENQRSVPANYIQEIYAHPFWIPVVKDNGGNNIAIDLAPGPSGRWGQIILFGRDFDTKYVVASSWNEFLLNFYEDLNEGKFMIDEIDEELTFYENGQTANYFNVLKYRALALDRANQRKLKQQQNPQDPSNIYSSLNASRSQSRVSLPRETLISPVNSSPNLNSNRQQQQPNVLLQKDQSSKVDTSDSNHASFIIDDEEDDHEIVEPLKEVLIEPHSEASEPDTAVSNLVDVPVEEPSTEVSEPVEETIEEPTLAVDEPAAEPVEEMTKKLETIDLDTKEEELVVEPPKPDAGAEVEDDAEVEAEAEAEVVAETEDIEEEPAATAEAASTPSQPKKKKNNKKKKGKKN